MMGIFDRFGGRLVDIIEWRQTDSRAIVYRFPRYRCQIKYGAKLIVAEGQTAILVDEGRLADVFSPGVYTLETANLPILSAFRGWSHGPESSFKADIYFFNIRDCLEIKWRTKEAVPMTDEQLGLVSLHASGVYTLRIEDAAVFLHQLVSAGGSAKLGKVTDQLTSTIVSRLPKILADTKTWFNRYSMAQHMKAAVQSNFSAYGLALSNIYVQNISLPDNVQKIVDERAGSNVLSDDAWQEYDDKAMLTTRHHEADANLSHQADESAPLPKIYYLMLMGERVGPMTIDDIYEQLGNGEVSAATMMWRKGMMQWQAIENSVDIDLGRLQPRSSSDKNSLLE